MIIRILGGLPDSLLLQADKTARKRTVIIFTSDHGDHDGAHGLTMKRSFYEESVNIPLIVCGPNVKNRGSVNTSGLINNGIDLIPTLCDYAGIEVPEGLEGVSFKGLVEGMDNWQRDYVVSQTNTGRMLRTAQYKYNVYFKDGKSGEQLFHMENDRLEKFNLANDTRYKEILTEHRDKLKHQTTLPKAIDLLAIPCGHVYNRDLSVAGSFALPSLWFGAH